MPRRGFAIRAAMPSAALPPEAAGMRTRTDPGERDAWLALAAVPGVGPAIFGRLVGQLGGAANVLTAARDGRLDAKGSGLRLGPGVIAGVAAAARDPAAVREPLDELRLWTLTPLDAGWPPRLAVLDAGPVVLYGWGDPGALDPAAAVAVVGTRRPTLVGRALASKVATRLADLGVVVVSGLAIGIDGAAHAAAVAARGRTIAVIGAGHREPGPRAHRDLVAAILAGGGAVISELPPDSPATTGTFPRRNRLLSALGDAVIVIEAPARSGALNTAHHALEQGRPLLVAPGRPGDPSTAGCLRLLRETEARPLVGLDELTEDLGLAAPTAPASPPADGTELSTAERRIAATLAAGPGDLDRLIEATGLSPGAVTGALTLLQLRGWVRPVGPAFLAAGPLLRGLGDGGDPSACAP